MKKNIMILNYAILFSLLNNIVIQGFNPLYHGKDPEVALAMLPIPGWAEQFIKEDFIKYFPYYKHYVEKISLLNSANIDISKLAYPYNQVGTLLPYNPIGYYLNSEYMEKLFQCNNIVNVIEIGSDYGLSTRHIASLLPKGGKTYAVDCWDTHEGYPNYRYIPFLSNIIHAGLTDKIVPIKQLSQDAVGIFYIFNLKFDFIYVDGAHDTLSVMRDLELYYPLLVEKGIMCGDDWMCKTVRPAIVSFAKKYNLTLYYGANFWFLKNEGLYQEKCFFDNYNSDIWKFN